METKQFIEALVVKRTYRQSRELLFKAWTEPDRLKKWFCPNPKNRVEAEVDLRIGGRYKISMFPASGDPWVVGGLYRDITCPEKLSFTWKWATDPGDGHGSLVTVEFLQVEAGTEMVLTHDELESEESRTNHGEGWNATVERLREFLEDPMEDLSGGPRDLLTAATQIQQGKQLAQMALTRFKDTFAHVPEDKLHWSPGASSKSPIRILAHTAYSNEYFAAILRGDQTPNLHEVMREMCQKEPEIDTREKAVELLDQTTNEVLTAYDKLDPARLLTDPRAAFIITLVGRHVDGHAAQIDYLQTTWGDLEDHFGM